VLGEKGNVVKRFLVIVLVVVVVVGLVITGGVVYLYLQWPAEKVLAVANDFLSREYGLRVEVSSSKIDWLRGVSVKNPRLLTTGGKVLLEGKELVIWYDIFALLHKELRLSKLTISGLYTTFDDVMMIQKYFASKQPQAKKSENFGFVIHQLVFVDSQIVYKGIPVNINVTWNLGSLTSPASYNGTLVTMYGRASFQGKGKTIRFQLENLDVARFEKSLSGFFVNRLAGEVFLQGAQYAVKGTSLSLLWHSNSITSPKYTCIYDGKKQTFFVTDAVVRYNESELNIAHVFYDVKSLLVQGRVNRFAVEFSDIVPEGKGKLSGDVNFLYEGKKLSSLDGSLELDGVKYGPLEVDGRFVVKGLTLDGSSTFVVGKNRFTLVSTPIGEKGLALRLSTERLDLKDLLEQKWPTTKQASSGKSLPIEDVVASFPLSLEVVFPEVVYDKVSVQNVRFVMNPGERFWEITEMGGEWLRGTVSGRGVLAGDYLRGKLKASGIRLHDLNPLLEKGRSIYGTLGATVEYQLPLTNLMMGYVSFQLVADKPELRNFVLQNQVSEVLYNLPLERLSFDSLTVGGEMREGKVYFSRIALDSYDIQVNASADIEWLTRLVRADIILSVSKDYVAGLPNVAKIVMAGYAKENRLVFQLRVTNTLDQPSVVLLQPER